MACLIIMQGVKRSPKMFDIFVLWLCAELDSVQKRKHAQRHYAMVVENNNGKTHTQIYIFIYVFIYYVSSFLKSVSFLK